ncbi:unnamed protein product [Boreogadus saida]
MQTFTSHTRSITERTPSVPPPPLSTIRTLTQNTLSRCHTPASPPGLIRLGSVQLTHALTHTLTPSHSLNHSVTHSSPARSRHPPPLLRLGAQGQPREQGSVFLSGDSVGRQLLPGTRPLGHHRHCAVVEEGAVAPRCPYLRPAHPARPGEEEDRGVHAVPPRGGEARGVLRRPLHRQAGAPVHGRHRVQRHVPRPPGREPRVEALRRAGPAHVLLRQRQVHRSR